MFVLSILLSRIITLPSHDIPLGLDCHVMLFVKSCVTKDDPFYFTISLEEIFPGRAFVLVAFALITFSTYSHPPLPLPSI